VIDTYIQADSGSQPGRQADRQRPKHHTSIHTYRKTGRRADRQPCTYKHKYIPHTHKQTQITHRQTDREAKTQRLAKKANIQTGRQANIHTHMQANCQLNRQAYSQRGSKAGMHTDKHTYRQAGRATAVIQHLKSQKISPQASQPARQTDWQKPQKGRQPSRRTN